MRLTPPRKLRHELITLLSSLSDGTFLPAEAQRVEQLAAEYPEVPALYARFMMIRSLLEWEGKVASQERDSGSAGGRTSGSPRSGAVAEPPPRESGGSPRPGAVPVFPLTGATHPLSFSGVLVSYLCAALVFAAGVAGARFWQPATGSPGPAAASQEGFQQAALPPGPSGPPGDLLDAQTVPADPTLAPGNGATANPVMVGKITGMSNCQWADPCFAVRTGDPVPMGRNYPLTAGLLEITYDCGAKVIVQGPAIYSAFRHNAGWLNFGKVTVAAGKLDRGRLIAVEKARGHVPPLHTVAAFCVDTPSAVIADNGDQAAEFGVEVDPSKATFTRVLQGTISVGAPGFPRPYSLVAGTCVWTGAGARHESLFIFKPGPETAMFVTKLPQPPPVCLTRPAAHDGGRTTGRSGG